MNSFHRFLHSILPRRNRKHFIIVSAPRTGSNMLVSMLSKHKDIYADYEIFNYIGKQEKSIRQILSDPYQHMLNCYSKGFKSGKKVVGFKLIYDQGRIEHVKKFVNSDFKELPDESRKRYINKAAFIKDFFDFSEMEKSFNKVWSFLGKKDKVHVIHLKRRNLLEAFYSYKIASLTDSWSSKYPSGIKTPDSIVLSISDCEYFFQERRKEEKSFDELFKEHRLLNLYYEDLLNSKQKTMKEVFRYFQLEPIDSDPDFKKQNNTPLNQSIRNYNELKKHFTDTEWFSFFNY